MFGIMSLGRTAMCLLLANIAVATMYLYERVCLAVSGAKCMNVRHT